MRIRKKRLVDDFLNDEEILATARIADALTHPVRIMMLRYILMENLARHTVTNKDLVAVFGYAQATISQHLEKLKIGGLLDVQKKGTSSCYYARVGKLSTFIETLKKIEPLEEDSGMPGFLRTDFLGSENLGVELDEELQPDYYDDYMSNTAYDSPRIL